MRERLPNYWQDWSPKAATCRWGSVLSPHLPPVIEPGYWPASKGVAFRQILVGVESEGQRSDKSPPMPTRN
jgi:hypothetical protein